MSTKIEWATDSWNPITGCTKISPGCKNCYAERMAKRLAGRYGYPKDEPFRPTFHADKLDQPSKWRKPRMVFVCSMGDLFHHDVKSQWRNLVFGEMTTNRQHTFLLLTKRPEKAAEFWHINMPDIYDLNIWLGVTAENQEQADNRIPVLLQIPAAKRFVSIEPMLGPVDLGWYLARYQSNISGLRYMVKGAAGDYTELSLLDWVILGGETGPGHRPMEPQWARDVRDQCVRAGVPFFMKKMAGGGQPPDDLMIREYPA
jgi:protein gp37